MVSIYYVKKKWYLLIMNKNLCIFYLSYTSEYIPTNDELTTVL